MFEDRINLVTLQAVIRYKLSLEDPKAKLEFVYAKDNSKVIIVVNNTNVLEGILSPQYDLKEQRALAYVEELKRLSDGSIIPTTHQSHLLMALYDHSLSN